MFKKMLLVFGTLNCNLKHSQNDLMRLTFINVNKLQIELFSLNKSIFVLLQKGDKEAQAFSSMFAHYIIPRS